MFRFMAVLYSGGYMYRTAVGGYRTFTFAGDVIREDDRLSGHMVRY